MDKIKSQLEMDCQSGVDNKRKLHHLYINTLKSTYSNIETFKSFPLYTCARNLKVIYRRD